jgi:hypothetical protein
MNKAELIKLLEYVFGLGVEATFSPAKAMAREKELDRIIKKIEKQKVEDITEVKY